MIVTAAYVSYEDQQPLYEAALLHYGQDTFMKYEDYPGYSEHQLGYTVTFTVAREDGKVPDLEAQGKEEQAKWLAENAYKYGFIVRYPKDKEARTGKQMCIRDRLKCSCTWLYFSSGSINRL